jgi:hypothetical protein
MVKVLSVCCCCAVLACVASCKSDGDDGGGNIAESSGVEETKPAPELTASEAESLCKAGSARLTQELSCTSDAAMRTEDQESCEMLRDSCLESRRTDDCDGEMVQADLAECDGVTAGDIAGCIEDLVVWLETLSCDNPGEMGPPPECAIELNTSCPKLFGDEMGSMGEPGGTGGTGAGGTEPMGGAGSGEGLQCESVDPGCVEAYLSFCDCCGLSEGCVANEDPCTRAAGLQTECDADSTCEPGCGNWVIGDCEDFRATMGESCMF